MPKIMKRISCISIIAITCCYFLYEMTNSKISFILAITFGTTAYHFLVRLLIGTIFDIVMQNKADYKKRWYRVTEREMQLYKTIKVKRWKQKMPTYDKEVFDVSKHSWDEIVQATCQSELVHETNIVFSFVPLIASRWFGAFEVFFITSVLSAIFDLIFVIMQRFNRARIIKVMKTK